MPYRPLLLLVPLLAPLTVISAAEDSLAQLVYLNDRLVLHPRVSAGGRYDSNVNATSTDPQDELAAIGALGLGLQFAWSEATTLTADAEASMVVTDRPEQRYRNQGAANIKLRRSTEHNTATASATYSRSDDPDALTGERLLVDSWSANLSGDLIGLIHRLSGALAFHRTDYLDSSRSFTADDRDSNTVSATIGYGLRLDGGDELTLRATGDRLIYDHTITNQDSTSVSALAGWSRQVSETIGLAIEGGAEYRHYDANNTLPATDVISPTWRVHGNTVTASESSWSLTLSGGLQDSLSGNPALESRAAVGYGHPISPVWSLNVTGEGYNLKDVETVAGQPKDDRWTVRGVIGTSYVFRPGLSGEIDAGYEYSDSTLQGNYDRISAHAALTARF